MNIQEPQAVEMSTQYADTLQDVKEEYLHVLQDLKNNSKPLINTLTIIAGENTHVANAIVSAIEQQLLNAIPARKLPLVYLIDSIIKNIGGVYIPTFTYNLPQIFVETYQSVDPATRASMEKVLRTWKHYPPLQGPIFDLNMLESIEALVHAYSAGSAPLVAAPAQQASFVAPPSQFTHLSKEQLMQSVQAILSVSNDLDATSLAILGRLMADHERSLPGSSQRLSDELVAQIQAKLGNSAAVDTQQAAPEPAVYIPLDSISINAKSNVGHALARKLDGIYPTHATQCQQCGLRFAHDTFHGGGIGTSSLMPEHLDWHFRENKRQRARTPRFESRNWFSTEQEWVQPQGLGPDSVFQSTLTQLKDEDDGGAKGMNVFAVDKGNQLGSALDSSTDLLLSPTAKLEADEHMVLYDSTLQNAVCAMCGEPLSKSWDDDNEQWVLKNAIKVVKTAQTSPSRDATADETPNNTQAQANSKHELKAEGSQKRKASESESVVEKKQFQGFTVYHWTCYKDFANSGKLEDVS